MSKKRVEVEHGHASSHRVSRREALRQVGGGIAGIYLAGVPSSADAGQLASTTVSSIRSIQTEPLNFGLGFGPYVHEGQDGMVPSPAIMPESQLQDLLQTLAPRVRWIRTFGCNYGLERVGHLAHQLGMKAAICAWLGKSGVDNRAQIQNLIKVAKAGEADLAIVGNEVLYRRDLQLDQLLSYIAEVRDALRGTGVPVTTGEVYYHLLSQPGLIAAVDVVGLICYPYYEGMAAENAVGALHGWFHQLKAVAGTKPVVVLEAGWPSCGEQMRSALPSPGNAADHFLNFASWARANGSGSEIPHFYFEAFNEPWKQNYSGAQEACWGVFFEDEDGNLKLKPGMERVFNGETAKDTWSGKEPAPGTTPAIEITHVPVCGTEDVLQGRVMNVRPADYKVAVYINVPPRPGGSAWWTKPTNDHPWTVIGPDGSWTCDFISNPDDVNATEFCAYLIPNDRHPTKRANDAVLPGDMALLPSDRKLCIPG